MLLRRSCPVLLAAWVGFAFALPCLANDEGAPEPVIEPIDIDFTEVTGRSLLFIDVEGVDREGRPLTGLQKEDFKIRVNYTWRRIYSVDDLCPCGDAAPDPDDPPTDPGEAARLALVQAPPHYVFYFDYSQLGAAGRTQAIEEAKRWTEEVMQPDDRVMVAAYATDPGLRTLTDFTSDKEKILRAIDEGAAAPDLQDPFPTTLGDRMALCADGTLSCYHTGRLEYRHARRSMETLRNFLTDLDEVPERKTIVLFHENATIFPGRMYGGAPSFFPESVFDEVRGYPNPYFERVSRMRRDRALVPDLLELEEQLGGTATASRAVVYPILCGSAKTWNVNFSANLADQTGGDYNRRIQDLGQVLDQAGRRCPCIYRIGLELPGKEKSFVLRTKIRVRGRKLPSRYRVQYLTDADRWMRKAQLVRANPGQWRDLDVRAAVVPIRASEKSWDVAVQVTFDVASLKPSPMDDHDGEWEVAALLARDEFRKTWEMLGVYRARREGNERLRGIMLHEQRFEDLKPGKYELRAFVRDRAENIFGGAAVAIELPVPEDGGLAGPVMVRPRGSLLRSPLPLRKKKKPAATETTSRESGPLPLGDRVTVSPGEAIQFLTWACSGDTSRVQSAVSRDDGELWVSKPVETRESGPCNKLSEIVDTDLLPPGSYAYEVSTGGDTPKTATAAFAITDSAETTVEDQR